MLGFETVLPRTYNPATERNLRGRSISSGVRFLIQDQLNPCLPPAKMRCIRSASVFAEHTRTNQISCAAEAVPIWMPIIGAIKNATINARIDPSISAQSPSGPSEEPRGKMKAGIPRIDFRQGQHRFTAASASRLGLARQLSGQNPTKGRLAQSPAPPSLSIKANRSPSSMKIRGDTVISCNYITPPFLRAPRQRLISARAKCPSQTAIKQKTTDASI